MSWESPSIWFVSVCPDVPANRTVQVSKESRVSVATIQDFMKISWTGNLKSGHGAVMLG